MAFKTLYKSLFEVIIHHSYFLDDGESSFISMTNEEKKEQLKTYDVLSYLDIVPSYATYIKMKNHKLFFKKNTKGFGVLNAVSEENNKLKSILFLNEDLKLTFYVYAKDYLFDNYTELTKARNRLYYFSNSKPQNEALPYTYISLESSNDLVTEDFLLTEESTQQIWYDIVQEDIRSTITPRLDLMAEIEESDLDTDRGKQIVNQSIQKEQSKGLLGIISLQMQGDNMMSLVEVDASDPNDKKSYLVDPYPQYKLHFENKKTIWRYIKRADQNELETSSAKPLTRNGFIEIDPDTDFSAPLPSNIEKYVFPNPTVDSIKQVTDENTNTTITYSEIYI